MKDNKLIIKKWLICLLNINNEGKNIHRINRALYYKLDPSSRDAVRVVRHTVRVILVRVVLVRVVRGPSSPLFLEKDTVFGRKNYKHATDRQTDVCQTDR